MTGIEAPLADITGLWVTVGDREYFTSEQASVTIDMVAGETLQVTGIRYGLNEVVEPEDGVIAFESYVRREHGAATIGSYDYTNGRFADPVAGELVGGEIINHGGFDSGWQLDVIDNRVAVVAVRYFGDEFVVEDRLLVDVNVIEADPEQNWTNTINPVAGEWDSVEEGSVGGDSRERYGAALTVIETGSAPGERYEIAVQAKTVEENTWANGFVVIDYRGENDFVYAGIRSIADKFVIGHYDGSFNDLESISHEIEPHQLYDLRVAVDGSHVALAADGVFQVSHDFERSLDQGGVGLANEYAFTHFSEFHLFRNAEASESDTTVITEQADLNAALVQATAAAQEARSAADEAATAAAQANAAKDVSQVALDEATDEHNDAVATAAAASDAKADAVAAVDQAEIAADQAEDAVQTAEEAVDQTDKTRRQTHNDLEQSQTLANEIAADFAEAEEDVAAAAEKAAATATAARETQSVSDVAETEAAAAASAAEAASDAAQDAKQAPKDVRKAAQAAAKAAKKVAKDAEKAADDAADAAEDAREDADKAAEKLQKAEDELQPIAEANRSATQQWQADERRFADAVEAANLAVAHFESVQDAVTQARGELQDRRAQRASAAATLRDATDATADSAKSLQEASESAMVANSDAQSANENSARASHEAALADQRLAAAAWAVEQAIAENESDGGSDATNGQGDSELNRAYSLNFNHQDAGAFQTVSGQSELVAGQIHLVSGDEQFALAVLDDEALPERDATRVYTTIRSGEDDRDGNGFIVFDYQSPDNFKFGGAWAGADRWVIGEVVDGQRLDVATLDEAIGDGSALELQVWIENSTLTFLVEGQQKLQHTFDDAIDDGSIGIANYGTQSRFDQVAIMQLHGGAGDAGIEDVDVTGSAEAADAAFAELF